MPPNPNAAMPIAIPNSPMLKFKSPLNRTIEPTGRITTTAYAIAVQEATIVNRYKFNVNCLNVLCGQNEPVRRACRSVPIRHHYRHSPTSTSIASNLDLIIFDVFLG